MTFHSDPDLLTTDEAAALLRVSASALQRSRKSGILHGMPTPEPTVITSKSVKYERSTIDAWIREHRALFDPDSITATAASRALGVSYKVLENSRRTGILQGRPAPVHTVLDLRGHCRYDRNVLAAWIDKRNNHSVSRKAVPDADAAAGHASAAVPHFLQFLPLDGEPQPLLVSIRQRTHFRASTLHEEMGMQWRYRLHGGGRVLLMAMLPLPDGDAMHGHLADDRCAALSEAAEELVLRLWRFTRSNPRMTKQLGAASRALAGRDMKTPAEAFKHDHPI